MKDFSRLAARLRQFGGIRLLREYYRMGVLWIGIREFVRCLFSRRSVKSIYPVLTSRVDNILLRQAEQALAAAPLSEGTGSANSHQPPSELSGVSAGPVWFCWLQGLESAPELVRTCYDSLCQHLSDEQIIVLDASNYTQYVQLPDFITQKYARGIIPHALFSDLLRLQLLIEHGGTWIDASVLCTGRLHWQEIRSSELFLFRYFKQGRVLGISNWFIHAAPHNAVLTDLQLMLHDYWRHYDCVVQYYIFHLFFDLAAKRHPDIMRRMPRGNSFAHIALGRRLGQPIDASWYEELVSRVSFHKLNYRRGQGIIHNS